MTDEEEKDRIMMTTMKFTAQQTLLHFGQAFSEKYTFREHLEADKLAVVGNLMPLVVLSFSGHFFVGLLVSGILFLNQHATFSKTKTAVMNGILNVVETIEVVSKEEEQK